MLAVAHQHRWELGASCPETRGEGAPELHTPSGACGTSALHIPHLLYTRGEMPLHPALESSPWSNRAALALTSPRHVYAGTGRLRMAERSWQAVGPRRAPAGGRAAPHPSQRRSGHPANAWLWHGASQAVAPMRAMSCEAAPCLGVTISPATQSKEKTSPSSTSVISIGGIGLSVWEWHYIPDRDMLRVQH